MDYTDFPDGTLNVSSLIYLLQNSSNALSSVRIPNAFVRRFRGVDGGLVRKVRELGDTCREASQLIEQGRISQESRLALTEELRKAEPIYLRLQYLEKYQK